MEIPGKQDASRSERVIKGVGNATACETQISLPHLLPYTAASLPCQNSPAQATTHDPKMDYMAIVTAKQLKSYR